MAKRKGPLGLLFKGLFLLAIVAGLLGVGVSIFYPDEDFGSQLRGAGVPEPQIKQALNFKRQIKAKADMSSGDLMFSVKSTWWDLRDKFDLDLTSSVTLDLPPVRHVMQKPSMPMEGDPKEPMAEPQKEAMQVPEVMPAAGQETPEPDETVKQAMMKAEEAAEKPAEPMLAEAAPAETAPEPAPEAPPATDKPMDLTKAPEEPKAEEPKAEETMPALPSTEESTPPKAEEVAALPAETPAEPAPAAPAEAPAEVAPAPVPATAEERLAAADLTYKRAVSLFAQAKSDEEKAEVTKLFAQAAIDGHPGAQFSVGVMHYNGSGVAQDFAKAAEWFGRAAEKSNASAQYNLGLLYYTGRGVPKDDKLAYKWISAAAENGDKKAIVARDTLKESLPADVTKPAESTFTTPAATSPTTITRKPAAQ